MMGIERLIAGLDGWWVYEDNEKITIGCQTVFGVAASQISKAEWIDWLRQELQDCQTVTVPDYIREFINGRNNRKV